MLRTPPGLSLQLKRTSLEFGCACSAERHKRKAARALIGSDADGGSGAFDGNDEETLVAMVIDLAEFMGMAGHNLEEAESLSRK
ncbi:hypothetical protein [Streptomyces sp. SYSU K217416]